MKILGLHIGHNATAALIDDKQVVAVVQEERLSRIKNAGGIPLRAIREVLKLGGLQGLHQVDRYAVCGRDPHYRPRDAAQVLRDYDRTFQRASSLAGKSRYALARHSGLRRLWETLSSNDHMGIIREELAQHGLASEKTTFVDHHTCHAAMAYHGYAHYDDKVLVLTNDGAGDRLCATVSIGQNGHLERIASVSDHHSIADIYAMITYLMGMHPLEHEYKVMGLAPYGKPFGRQDGLYASLSELIQWDKTDPMIWRRRAGVPIGNGIFPYLHRLVARQRFDHIAAAVQAFTERFLTEWVRRCVKETGIRTVCLSGGIFMNVKANQLILALPEVERLFIVPSCGDESNACGAAYVALTEYASPQGGSIKRPGISSLYWGGMFSDGEVDEAIQRFVFATPVSVKEVESSAKTAAALLAEGKVVARFADRMEFGARALGNRSILADASRPDVVRLINEAIKARDFWMPFAPSILSERSKDYIARPKAMDAPYMSITFDSQAATREACRAAMHPYDFTLRPQEVTSDANPSYYSLLTEYEQLTGRGLVLNTSFNLHGEPLVYTPSDALRVFDLSGLTDLVIGKFHLQKK